MSWDMWDATAKSVFMTKYIIEPNKIESGQC